MEIDVRPVPENVASREAATAAGVPTGVDAWPEALDQPWVGATDAARLSADRRQAGDHAAHRILERAQPIDERARNGCWEHLSGELELRRIARQAVNYRGAAVLVGWTPQSRLRQLSAQLAACGTSVVGLPHPARVPAPTLITGSRASRPFTPLVETYGAVPYSDVDPTLFAALAYVLMFGMMFGDVGHGLILAGLGLYLRRSGRPTLASLRRVWPLIVAAGLTAAAFGVLYGEVFGPTGILPPVWISPMEEPITLLAAGIVVGAILLAMSYVIGIVNRWREGGSARALYAASGIAGACLYFGAASAAAGVVFALHEVLVFGVATACAGLALLFIGFLTASGGGIGGVLAALVEVVDSVVRTVSNAVSFARLAAFGLTHAAIGAVVWTATVAIAAGGGPRLLVALAVFIAGNVVAFGLEALVAAVQSLRLEYYELFSRIFSGEGRIFTPWHPAVAGKEEA
jgi:V/A-type H+-transporting ATPase subunit I